MPRVLGVVTIVRGLLGDRSMFMRRDYDTAMTIAIGSRIYRSHKRHVALVVQ